MKQITKFELLWISLVAEPVNPDCIVESVDGQQG